MSLRRLHHEQPLAFAFNAANEMRVWHEMAKYPAGRQASAVIAALWIGQEQEGWVTKPMIEAVARFLDMPYIRVLEVATFYTMFNLEPVGKHLVQVCTDHALLAARFGRRRQSVQEAHPRKAAHRFRRRQVLLDGSGMLGRLR